MKILFAKKLKEASFSGCKQQETVVNKRAKQTTMKKRKKKGNVNQKDTGDSFEGMLNQMGWALKQRKKNTKFSRAQVKFLLEIYSEGEISGKKKDPSRIVQMMKCSTKENGDSFLDRMNT